MESLSDRELLELAAKAAGVKLTVEWLGHHAYNPEWSPLTDDGDALRLAVKIGWEECQPYIEGALEAARVDGKCQLSAVRFAIVRAAAAIGAAM